MTITRQILFELLAYEPQSGKLYWQERDPKWFSDKGNRTAISVAKTWNRSFAGKEAGTIDCNGRVKIALFGKMHKAHRLIWVMAHDSEPDEIDHIDGNPSNNRIENLRAVDHSENMKNAAIRADNTSGVVGVSFDRSRLLWAAEIVSNGKRFRLGRFGTKEEAVAARRDAEVKLGFHGNHGQRQTFRVEKPAAPSQLARSNSSGATGVSWHSKGRKWNARIKRNRKNISLGLFHSFEDAVAARKAAERQFANQPSDGR